MKKYCFIFILTLCLSTIAAHAGLSMLLGINTGVGTHVNSEAHYFPVGLMGNGSLDISVRFNDRLSIITGIGLSASNYSLYKSSVNSYNNISGTPSLDIRYLDIPLMLRMENRGPSANNNLRFYVQAGALFGFYAYSSDRRAKDLFYSNNIRPCFGSGFNFAMSRVADFTVGCTLSTSFRNECKDQQYANVTLTAYCLKFGFQFHIG